MVNEVFCARSFYQLSTAIICQPSEECQVKGKDNFYIFAGFSASSSSSSYVCVCVQNLFAIYYKILSFNGEKQKKKY
jgi:hypothetical protein